jgi:hypothetical protein
MTRGLALAAAVLGLAAPAAAEGPHGSFAEKMDCSACHTSAGWGVTAKAGGGGFDHAETGFPLAGTHKQTTCSNCHQPERPTPRACSGCHDDAHAGRLGEACAECHSAIDWRDTQVLERHRRTRLPLTGRHAIIDCTACHRRTTERAFSHLPADCFACHAKDYRGNIHPDHDGDPANPGLVPFPRDCGACHRTAAWTPAVINPAVLRLAAGAPRGHDLRFVLSYGKHRGLACDSCHAAPAEPRRVRCDGCHDAPSLRRRHAAVAAVSASGCLRCHPGGTAR